jgi:RNA polymerase sigma-70 factor (ECF subfamily)
VRFLNAREPGAGDDIASETWLTVATKLEQFQGDEIEFRAWIFAIAPSRLVDWQRRKMSRPQTTSDAGALETLPTSDDTAGQALESLDTHGVLALIGQLPADQSDVILLRVVAGVAEIIGKRPGSVRMLQLRGLRRLRDLVGSEDFRDQDVTR